MITELPKTIAAKAKSPPPKKAIAEIKHLMGHYREAWRGANVTFTDTAAKTRWAQQQAAHSTKHRTGEDVGRAYSYEDICRDYATRQLSCKDAMYQATAEAVAPAAELRAWFISQLEPLLKAAEKAEQDDHADWGIPWQPSAKVRELREALDWARATMPVPGRGFSPAGMVPFLDLN